MENRKYSPNCSILGIGNDFVRSNRNTRSATNFATYFS